MHKQGTYTKLMLKLAVVASLSVCSALTVPSVAMAQDDVNAAALHEANTRAELELRNKDAQIKQLKSVLNEKNAKLDELSDQLAAQELLLEEKERLQKEIAAKEKLLAEKEEALGNIKGNIAFKEGREAELNSLMNQMQQIVENHEVLLGENEKYKEMLKEKEGIEQKLSGISEEKRMLAENMQILQDEYDSTTEQLNVLKEDKLAAYEEQIAEKDLEVAELRQQVQVLSEQAGSGAALVAQQDRTIGTLQQQVNTYETQAQTTLSEAQKMERSMQETAEKKPGALLPTQWDDPNARPDPTPMQESGPSKNASILQSGEGEVSQRLDDLAFENHELQRQNEALKAFLADMTNTIRDVASAQTLSTMVPPPEQGDMAPVSLQQDLRQMQAPAQQPPPQIDPVEYSNMSEAQRMEAEMMLGQQAVSESTVASAAPVSVQHAMPVQAMPAAAPQSVAPPEQLGQPKSYYDASVPIYGLVQAAEGYVPNSFGLLADVSGQNKLVYQWSEEQVYSSAEQRPIGDMDFDDLVLGYLVQTESRCQGDFAAVPVDTRDVGDVRIDSYDIACIMGEDQNAAASLMFFNKDGTFSSVSHETATAYVDVAMDKRDKMIHTLEGASFF